MRVVAGSARGMNLSTVPGQGTRPILDRVKTSLFDILRPRIEGLAVLDLFAGSGGVGIEALSQGAARCHFVDVSHRAIVTIRKNLALTGFRDRAEVHESDAFGYLRGARQAFDLIYLAPPQYQGLWVEALVRIAARPELLRGRSSGSGEGRADGLLVVQIDPKEYKGLDLAALHETRHKQYGNTLLVFFELSSVPTSE